MSNAQEADEGGLGPRAWCAPLSTCWYSLGAPGHRLVEVVDGGPVEFLPAAFTAQVQGAINELKSCGA